MKVFVQVPCLNEEETLPAVLQSIPAPVSYTHLTLPTNREV